MIDGRSTTQLNASTGYPVSSDWLLPHRQRPFDLATSGHATCVLVVEKEGVYSRLVEDGLHRRHPCILVTGKGFPDLATRAMVHACHRELGLPVYGLADCDPHGVMVLHTYKHSERPGVDGGSRYGVPIKWLGLRPSQVDRLKKRKHQNNSGGDYRRQHSQSSSQSSSSSTASDSRNNNNSNPAATAAGTGTGAVLPDAVFLKLNDLDKRRIENHLLSETHRWTDCGQDDRRVEELQDMIEGGYKVELEALNWLGMDYCTDWVCQMLDRQLKALSSPSGNGGGSSTSSSDDSSGEDEAEGEWMEII